MASANAWVAAVLAIALGGCVTVNVNFPESAAQKATDEYVRDLYRAKERGKVPAPAPESSSSPQSRLEPKKPVALTDLLIASAWAEESLFKVQSEKTASIKERLRSRLGEVMQNKKLGVLGEDNQGMLILKDPSKLKKLQLTRVEKLVADENADRSELYSEVARLNNISDARQKDVRRSFSHSFQAESPSGTWVQTDAGEWSQKQ